MSALGDGLRNAASFVRATAAAIPQTSRSLRRAPGFVAIAALSLGAALGMSTSVFALIDAMTHPVSPYAHSEQLFEVRVFSFVRHGPSASELHDGLAGIPGVKAVTSSTSSWLDVEAGESIVKVMVASTGTGFFDVLAARPRLGRLASPDEMNAQSVALVSDDFWKQQFGNRSAIGDTHITIGDHQYIVVGVLPPHTTAPINTSVWLPGNAPRLGGEPFVRLDPGVMPKDIQPQLNAIMHRFTQAYATGPTDRPFAASMVTLIPDPIALKDFHKALIGAAICVLIIACANVAALMLSRGTVRTRDYALRLAIGATRADIAREVMFEVAALAVIGSIAGAIVAAWGVGLITHAMPMDMHRYGFAEPQWSARVLGLSALAVMIAVGVAGGIPAWRASRTDPSATLKDSSGGNTGRSSTRFRWLVVTELALSMTLLVGASLMLKSERIMAATDFGLDKKNLLTAELYLKNTGSSFVTADLVRTAQEALARIRAVPGVASATSAAQCTWDRGHPIITTDRTVAGGTALTLPNCTMVGTDFVQTYGYQVVEGRDLELGDAQGNGAVLLDQKTAHRLFPHESAVGRTMKFGDIASTAPWMTVVGVVRDKDIGFKSVLEAGKDTSDVLFVSATDSSRGPYFYPIRVAPGARNVRVLVSRALLAMAPQNSFIRVAPLTEAYESQLREQQFLSLLFSLLGAASLALGAAGLFSVVSYLASQRM
ncbi:MAG TPA: ABC transporter permease, partial [Gemmatimonadaceae bacterium]|nr:ABC transporter permease [Gemmatimonadaceae bacterium]